VLLQADAKPMDINRSTKYVCMMSSIVTSSQRNLSVSWRKDAVAAPPKIEIERTLDINPARAIINVATANA